MRPTRVVLGPMADITRDLLIEAVGGCDDIRIVAELSRQDDPVRAVSENDAHVLITHAGSSTPGDSYRQALYAAPTLRVLRILGDGHSAELCQLEVSCQTIDSVGLTDLLSLLRQGAEDVD